MGLPPELLDADPPGARARRTVLLAGWGLLLAAILAAGALRSADDESGQAALVARGKYLVTAGGCNDCHTPAKVGPRGPEPDLARLLSGHPEGLTLPPPPALPAGSPWSTVGTTTGTAFAGPWGVSYASNLTPDPATGLAWSERQFVRAMRSGRHGAEGRPILPPMPWSNLARLGDKDLEAIYAYLRTLPAVRNRVPDAVPTAGPTLAAAPPPRRAGSAR